jgi:hypothetical protein
MAIQYLPKTALCHHQFTATKPSQTKYQINPCPAMNCQHCHHEPNTLTSANSKQNPIQSCFNPTPTVPFLTPIKHKPPKPASPTRAHLPVQPHTSTVIPFTTTEKNLRLHKSQITIITSQPTHHREAQIISTPPPAISQESQTITSQPIAAIQSSSITTVPIHSCNSQSITTVHLQRNQINNHKQSSNSR